jgi:hypothetical protein
MGEYGDCVRRSFIEGGSQEGVFEHTPGQLFYSNTPSPFKYFPIRLRKGYGERGGKTPLLCRF